MMRDASKDMRSPTIDLFLSGDVMTGRGIDQILPHPCSPRLHEQYVGSAVDYVHLAEDANGEIGRPVSFSYVWGAALEELDRRRPDLRIVNLETSITRSETYLPKGINYRMSPENVGCLRAAGIDCCVLANNHVLDWGRAGLLDTLSTLEGSGIETAGAGRCSAEAWSPAIFDIPGKGRVLVYSCACESSGAPLGWAATADAPGVALLPDLSETALASIEDAMARERRDGDVVVLSLHWGPNWGYGVSREEQRFAHRLIDRTRISVLHCHSSHHPKGIEAYGDRLILYGCGDFLNDYEGIAGYERFRGDLVLMYFVDIDPARGDVVALDMTPLRIRRFRLVRPSSEDVEWLRRMLDRESRKLGASVEPRPGGRFALSWPRAGC